MRISGLASGMDIEEIVKQLMNVERIPVNRLYQEKQALEWKREDYRNINSQLLSFRNKVFDMRLSSTYLSKSINVSKPEILNAVAGGQAQEGIYEIIVEKIATKAYANSTERLVDKKGEPLLVTDALINVFDFTDLESASFKIKAGDDNEFVEIRFDYDVIGDNIINIDIEKDSLKDLMGKINNSGAGIHMFYDGSERKMFISSNNPGEDIYIQSTGGTAIEDSFIMSSLKIDLNNTDAYRAAKKATFYINGYKFEGLNSNTITFGGITYTLKAETSEPVYLEISQDINKAFNAISEFVEQYNKLITTINTKLKEPYYRNFPPLTDEQKEAMSDKEIELWEEKAKSGLIRKDIILTSAMSRLRIVMGSTLSDGDIRTLSQIGITTSANYLDGGLLNINEEKLRKALIENPNSVYNLFAVNDEEGGKQGIAIKLQEILDLTIKTITDRAGQDSSLIDRSYLAKQINDTEKRIETMEERLIKIEERYWQQFTAMEKALSEMYAQSDWLYMQLMSMMNYY
jgi:flagellar hook-associated protein 2